MNATAFDASRYLTDLNGRGYLEVKWRPLWLRTEHPDANIQTELVKQEDGLALFRARVLIPGAGEATGWGSETASDFHDYIEKAETKALGRALAALGYGTQFCEDFDFSADRRGSREHSQGMRPPRKQRLAASGEAKVVDSPISRKSLNAIKSDATATVTEPQLKAIYAIAREKRALEASGLDSRCREAYGCAPNELTKRQASEFIDRLRQSGVPVEAPAPVHA